MPEDLLPYTVNTRSSVPKESGPSMAKALDMPQEPPVAQGFEDRLEVLLDQFETRKSAAEVAGKSVDQLQAYLKGRSAVPLEPIARMCSAKGVSLDWLAFGTPAPAAGPSAGFAAVVDQADGAAAGRNAGREHRTESDKGRDDHDIPPYVALCGSQTADASTTRTAPVPAALVHQLARRVSGPLATLTAPGDAMAPTVNDGDLVVVDTGDVALSDGSLYALRTNGHPLLRRVARQAHGGVRLLADRPGYGDELVAAAELDQLDVIGRIVWAASAR